jgi:hypothetical protein
VNEFLAAVPLGALFGVLYGSLRLAGVDYGKWYRDPGEVSEGNDRSWIGLMKGTALTVAHWLLLATSIIGALSAAHSLIQVHRDNSALFHKCLCIEPWLLSFFGAALGLIFGLVLTQALVEGAWRIGLLGSGRPVQIRLARVPRKSAPWTTPQSERRRLIVCCDGTWNSPEQKRETNVIQLLRAIRPVGESADHPITQISYYHLGVGTGNLLDRVMGGGAGVGLSSSVKGCYGFLVDNYRPGDEILLIGFSRGAYVVRSVAGLIGLAGLLLKGEMFRFAEIWDYYTLPVSKRTPYNLNQIAPARISEVQIACIGVWDTVGALGIPGSKFCSSAYAFHDTSLGAHVRHAFQALAIDERRGNFQPAVWVKEDAGQVLKQVWFPGVHSDVGGGYLTHGLSDTTLLWMLAQLREHRLLDFDAASVQAAVNRATAELYPGGRLHDSRKLLWKLIACPVPRPVGITDDSERIHESAIQRSTLKISGDPYASRNRDNWLGGLGAHKIARRTELERELTFQGVPPGNLYQRVVPPKRGFCAWLSAAIFGTA